MLWRPRVDPTMVLLCMIRCLDKLYMHPDVNPWVDGRRRNVDLPVPRRCGRGRI